MARWSRACIVRFSHYLVSLGIVMIIVGVSAQVPTIVLVLGASADLGYHGNIMSFFVDIDESGRGLVTLNATSLSSSPFRILVPKTLRSLTSSCNNSEVVLNPTTESNDELWVTPLLSNASTFLYAAFSWPDCAVPFRGLWYVGGDVYFNPCPEGFEWIGRIQFLLPTNARLHGNTTSNEWQVETEESRVMITYETDWTKKPVRFACSLAPCTEQYSENHMRNVVLSYPSCLSNWSGRVSEYVDSGFSYLEGMTQMRSEELSTLKITFVPRLYLLELLGDKWYACYRRNEDTAYIPSECFYSISFGTWGVQTLYHEMAHAFEWLFLPPCLKEGAAEQYADQALRQVGLTGLAEEYLSGNSKDPRTSSLYNSTQLFQWSYLTDYDTYFFFARDLVNQSEPEVLPRFFMLLKNDNLRLPEIGPQPTYDYVALYLSQAGLPNAEAFFSSYGLEVHPSRLVLGIVSLISLLSLLEIWAVVRLYRIITRDSWGVPYPLRVFLFIMSSAFVSLVVALGTWHLGCLFPVVSIVTSSLNLLAIVALVICALIFKDLQARLHAIQ